MSAESDDTIVIKAPAGTKARWIRIAGGEKLSSWVIRMIDEPADPERYIARFARKPPGSMVMLTEDELHDVMRKAYVAGAYKT